MLKFSVLATSIVVFVLGVGLLAPAQPPSSSGTVSSKIWIQKSFILPGEPDLDLFGEDEIGAIGALVSSRLFGERVAKSEQVARLPTFNGADAARRIADGLSAKRSHDSKQPILTISFQGPDQAQARIVLQAAIDALPHFLNDARQAAWEAMLRNQDNIKNRAEASLSKAETNWLALQRKAPAELANGNLETRQAALTLSERELTAREHDLTLHIETMSYILKNSTDPAAARLAIHDWRIRNNLVVQEKEPVAPEAVIAALRLERDGVRHARTINNQEYKTVFNQLLSSAAMLSQAGQLRSQLEIARSLFNDATSKSLALETRRESLPVYVVTTLSRPE